MRVLVLGATGFIGSAIASRLNAAGHAVVGVSRPRANAPKSLACAHWVNVNLAHAITPEAWLPHLDDIDAVVNCAGVLQSNTRDNAEAVHVHAPAALYQACIEKGIRRVVLISAIGVDHETPTEFSSSKRAGEQALEQSGLHWVILRPSVVVGHAAFGGTALIRALAALPILPKIAGARPVEVVQVSELANTVMFFLQNKAPKRIAMDVAGPQQSTVDEVIQTYRQWLGWERAWIVPVPAFWMQLTCRVGDALSFFGWRSPMRTTSIKELARGRQADTAEWTKHTGIRPQALEDALKATPPSVQERWFAKLYMMKAVIIGTLAVYWIASGLIALGPGWKSALQQMQNVMSAELASAAVYGTAALDIVVGLAILFQKTAKPALLAAGIMCLGYLAAGTYLAPNLWADPLGPLLKIVPIFVLIVTAYAIVDER